MERNAAGQKGKDEKAQIDLGQDLAGRSIHPIAYSAEWIPSGRHIPNLQAWGVRGRLLLNSAHRRAQHWTGTHTQRTTPAPSLLACCCSRHAQQRRLHVNWGDLVLGAPFHSLGPSDLSFNVGWCDPSNRTKWALACPIWTHHESPTLGGGWQRTGLAGWPLCSCSRSVATRFAARVEAPDLTGGGPCICSPGRLQAMLRPPSAKTIDDRLVSINTGFGWMPFHCAQGGTLPPLATDPICGFISTEAETNLAGLLTVLFGIDQREVNKAGRKKRQE